MVVFCFLKIAGEKKHTAVKPTRATLLKPTVATESAVATLRGKTLSVGRVERLEEETMMDFK